MSKRQSSSNVGQLTLYDGLKKKRTDESSSSNAHTGRGIKEVEPFDSCTLVCTSHTLVRERELSKILCEEESECR